LQQSPDAAGEVAFEAAQRFAAALAFGLLAREVGGGVGVQAAVGDGEAVQRAVERAVAAAVEAVPGGASRRCRDRCQAGEPSELGVAGESLDAGDLAISLAAVSAPQPRSSSSGCAIAATREASSLLESVDRSGQLGDAPKLVAGDPHPRGLLGAHQASADAVLLTAGGQDPRRDLAIKVSGRERIALTVLFVVATIFWATVAAVPGSIPQRVFAGVLCVSFGSCAWHAGRGGEVDDDDPADTRMSDWLN
jgi:hypothetical protein